MNSKLLMKGAKIKQSPAYIRKHSNVLLLYILFLVSLVFVKQYFPR